MLIALSPLSRSLFLRTHTHTLQTSCCRSFCSPSWSDIGRTYVSSPVLSRICVCVATRTRTHMCKCMYYWQLQPSHSSHSSDCILCLDTIPAFWCCCFPSPGTYIMHTHKHTHTPSTTYIYINMTDHSLPICCVGCEFNTRGPALHMNKGHLENEYIHFFLFFSFSLFLKYK